ncbi:hypothetical protein GOC13_24530 [Sinorhizobium meliloti]|nr:hypothetical protein [Sinorhizobium meliloti]
MKYSTGDFTALALGTVIAVLAIVLCSLSLERAGVIAGVVALLVSFLVSIAVAANYETDYRRLNKVAKVWFAFGPVIWAIAVVVAAGQIVF